MHFVLNKLIQLHSPQLTVNTVGSLHMLANFGDWNAKRILVEHGKLNILGLLIQHAVVLFRGWCEIKHRCYLDGTSNTFTLCTGNK